MHAIFSSPPIPKHPTGNQGSIVDHYSHAVLRFPNSGFHCLTFHGAITRAANKNKSKDNADSNTEIRQTDDCLWPAIKASKYFWKSEGSE